MSLQTYNKQQVLEALKNADSKENRQAYQEDPDTKILNPDIHTLANYYLTHHMKEFRDKNQQQLDFSES